MCAGIMVGGLTTGRMLIAQSAIDSLKIGCTIAVRYALQRPQFGDTPIMHYVTHQLRLLPALGAAYALHLGVADMKKVAFSGGTLDAERAKQVHVMSAGIKAAATWYKVDGLQKCRECCGGMGFLAINKIGPMAVDTNVDATFEGDNTVMMQQVAKALVDAAARGGAPRRPPPANPSALGAVGAAAATGILGLLKFRCVAFDSSCVYLPCRACIMLKRVRLSADKRASHMRSQPRCKLRVAARRPPPRSRSAWTSLSSWAGPTCTT